jgi:hypothetical protein
LSGDSTTPSSEMKKFDLILRTRASLVGYLLSSTTLHGDRPARSSNAAKLIG